MNRWRRAAAFVREDNGAELVEYAVMVALVVSATIVALASLVAALISQTQNVVQILSGS